MFATRKPLDQQVVVITGASSGIGLATARMAAEAGAVQTLYKPLRPNEVLQAVSKALAGTEAAKV